MLRRLLAVVIALALLATAAACAPRRRGANARDDGTVGPCAQARPKTPGTSKQTIVSGGVARRYELRVPPGYDGTRGVPLLFLFHGYSGDAHETVFATGFGPYADEHDFVLVAPEGQGNPQHFAAAFGLTLPGDRDDVAFTKAILKRMDKQLCIDHDRIYAAGMSNGAGMASLLGCGMADRLAAVAAVGAVLFHPKACDGSPPIPILAMAGTDDPLVPFAGGTVNCCGNPRFPAVGEAIARWAAHNDCALEPDREALVADVEIVRWPECSDGADVVLYVLRGGGHTWPGSTLPSSNGKTITSFSATDEIWKFFTDHARG